MSTDDFETRLRARLADLADREDDWDDPTPAAREIAAAGIAPDDDPAILSPPPSNRERRRRLPGLAVAAVLLAVVAGGGLGLRELVQHSSTGSAASSSGNFAEGGDAAADAQASDAATVPGPASAGNDPAGSCVSGTPAGDCHDTAGCEVGGAPTSTGPLAANGSIRPSGITGSRTTPGGSVAVPYQLSFAAAGGTAQFDGARAVWVDGGQLCASPGTALPGVVQAVPVDPGTGVSGSARFSAVDSRGEPLPNGEYEVVIVVSYTLPGAKHVARWQLVSAPVTVTVSS